MVFLEDASAREVIQGEVLIPGIQINLSWLFLSIIYRCDGEQGPSGEETPLRTSFNKGWLGLWWSTDTQARSWSNLLGLNMNVINWDEHEGFHLDIREQTEWGMPPRTQQSDKNVRRLRRDWQERFLEGLDWQGTLGLGRGGESMRFLLIQSWIKTSRIVVN